ncbi:hypothetical protein H0X32_02490 [Patescibacteria group bacterium]|nr:hypothetical protein [Patescibacteria group bacterium]
MVLRILTVIILLLVVGYGVKEAWALIAGPELAITSPRNGERFDTAFISISGTAVHTKSVSLDGGPLLIDQKGRFSKTLVLPQGGAILTLTATDRFGRTTTAERTIFVP